MAEFSPVYLQMTIGRLAITGMVIGLTAILGLVGNDMAEARSGQVQAAADTAMTGQGWPLSAVDRVEASSLKSAGLTPGDPLDFTSRAVLDHSSGQPGFSTTSISRDQYQYHGTRMSLLTANNTARTVPARDLSGGPELGLFVPLLVPLLVPKEVSQAEGGTISGTVLESDGVTPVANAFVSASGIDPVRFFNQTTTAADGSYSVAGLVPGSYLVEAHASAQGFMEECYLDDPLCLDPTPVTVSQGVDTNSIDFTLEKGGTISGIVMESDGVTPVSNASVYASGISIEKENGVLTAADGSYSIGGLPADNYRVEVYAADQRFLYECYRDDVLCQSPTPVEVTLGAETSSIDFTLDVGGTISGIVMESDGVTPVSSATVYASGIDIGFGNGAATAGDGSYTIRGLPAGNYQVDILFGSGQGFLSECYQDDLLCQNPTPVGVTLGEDTANIDFTLEVGGSISGTVLESDGVTPLADVIVFASGMDFPFGNGAVTAEDGGYTIPGMAPGNYKVEVHIVDQVYLNECYQDDLFCQNPTPVSVALDANTPDIDFTLEVERPNAASLSPHQDPVDGASGLKLSVTQDPGADALLGGFQAQLNYPDASENPAFPDGTFCVNVLDVRQMDLTVTGPDIDNAAGSATFGGSDAAGVDWPVDLGHALLRITGSASQQCRVDLTLTSLSDTDGNPLETPEVVSQVVQRGDARADGEVNMADARSIAQYLVGSRLACTTQVDIECLHSVNSASVKPDGEADGKTAADALLIAQQSAGLRDEYYNLVP